MDVKYITFGKERRLLIQRKDGDYQDNYGTIYPAILWDKEFCGLAPAETGAWDPFWKNDCKPHDEAFNRLKTGYLLPNESNLSVATKFAGSVIETMAQGAYAVTLGIPYLIVGAGLGMLRWLQLENKD